MREETEFRPKPMVEIGGIPLIVHLMRIFAAQGNREFVICAGYRADMIHSFFSSEMWQPWCEEFIPQWKAEDWKVVVLDTGTDTPTGGRIALARDAIGAGPFFCTYGDSLAPVETNRLLALHKASSRPATVTLAHPRSRFGVAELEEDFRVSGFREKPVMDELVSIGFFIFENEVFTRLTPKSVLEEQPINGLARDGQLSGYTHHGFWQPLDTYRELLIMQELWKSGQPPWLELPEHESEDSTLPSHLAGYSAGEARA